MRYQVRKVCSLISGCLIHTVFGAIYTLGTITPYIASYLKYNGNPDIRVVDISINYPIDLFAQTIGTIVSMLFLQRYISLKLLCIIGIVCFSISVFLASFMTNLATFVLFYGVIFGFSTGIAYLCPFKNTFSYYPNRKGLCSGCCMMGYGIGSFIYNQIFLHLINPNNIAPNQDHIFPEQVASNFPFALKIMAGVYFLIGSVGCLLFFEKKPEQYDQYQLMQSETSQKQHRVSEFKILRNYLSQNKQKKKQAVYIILIMFFSSVYGAFMGYNYKQYGEIVTTNDHLITLVGSFGALSNSLSRIGWCIAFDYLSFRTIMSILGVFLLFFCTLCIFTTNQVVYVIVVIGSYLMYGALYGIMPTQTFRAFGQKIGSVIYPFLFFGFVFSSITQFAFHQFVIRKWGNDGFKAAFIAFAIFQLFSIVMIHRFNITYEDNKIAIDKEQENQQSQKSLIN